MSGLYYYSLLFALCCSLVAPAQSIYWDKEGDLKAVPSVRIQSLPQVVNQGYSATRPIVAPSGDVLFFSRDQHPQNVGFDNQSDIWATYPSEEQEWSRAINLGAPVNDRESNQVVSISASEDTLFLTQDFNTLTWATRQGRMWSRPQSMTIDGADSWSNVADMHVGPDGQTLLLAMQTDDQGYDLFVSFRTGPNTWDVPQNLGPIINTSADEKGITLAFDGQTIFFSSDGRGGEGGQDIFISQRLGEVWTAWSTPQNLGPGLNTSNDEQRISLTAAGKKAYLSLESPEGHQQLYRVFLPASFRPQPVTLLSGRLVGTFLPEQTQIELRPLDGSSNRRKTITVAPDGSFQTIVPNGVNIGLSAKAEGYLAWNDLLPLSDNQLEELDYDPGVLTASLTRDEGYMQRNEEIQMLQLKLEGLNATLADIQEEREAYQQKLADDRARYAEIGLQMPKSSDPELDALVHQYESYIYNFEETEEVLALGQQDQYLNDTITPPANVAPKEKVDNELEELRQRFNSFHQQSSVKKEAETAESDTLLWERPMSYEDFQAPPPTKPVITPKGVSDTLIEEARRELEVETDPQMRALLQAEEERLKAQIAKGFTPTKETDSWEQQVQPETVQPLVPPNTTADWEKTLKEDIKDALKTELSYRATKSSAQTTRQELENKIQQQIQSEKEAGYAPAGRPDEIAEKTQELTPRAPDFQRINKEIALTPVAKGQNIPLNNIFFKPNTAELKSASEAGMEHLFTFLQEHPTLVVEIGVHTNGWVSHALAMELSAQRAKTIVEQLIEKGIAANRLQTKGYGKTKPITTNDTLEGRRLNQRIELIIIAE